MKAIFILALLLAFAPARADDFHWSGWFAEAVWDAPDPILGVTANYLYMGLTPDVPNKLRVVPMTDFEIIAWINGVPVFKQICVVRVLNYYHESYYAVSFIIYDLFEFPRTASLKLVKDSAP